MKLLTLSLLASLVFSSYGFACGTTEVNGQELNIKRKAIPFWSNSATSYTNFFISNTSNKQIEVRLDLYKYDGSVYSYASTPVGATFTNSNSPINSWASIDGEHVGVVQIPVSGSNDFGQAKIKWRYSDCIANPVTVTTWQGFNNNTDVTILSTVKL